MLVYVDRDSWLVYGLMEIDKDSTDYEIKHAVEIPDELVARHKKAQDEYGEVQELLEEIWDREDA